MRIGLHRLQRFGARSLGSSVPARQAGTLRPSSEASQPLPEVSFEQRMTTVDFRVSSQAHITVDSAVCRSCTTKECVHCCPADLFVPVSDGGILFNYEQCFECGTCYMVCNREGAITWSYPEGGSGVVFKHS